MIMKMSFPIVTVHCVMLMLHIPLACFSHPSLPFSLLPYLHPSHPRPPSLPLLPSFPTSNPPSFLSPSAVSLT